MPRPSAEACTADSLEAVEQRKQLARAGPAGRRAVKMAAVVEVEVGAGAAGETWELDEVRRVEN